MSVHTAARGMGRRSIKTGTDTYTSYFEAGQQVYPCRCGKTHRGDYAYEDWNHHTCFHGPMWLIEEDQIICSQCGASWQVAPLQPAIR